MVNYICVRYIYGILQGGPVEDLCCKPKYWANIIHHFIFVFFLYFSITLPAVRIISDCLILKFGTANFTDPGALKIWPTLERYVAR